jgi:sugar O-acyltransferase (sialic acid O-acetyltransferase NeuD family)
MDITIVGAGGFGRVIAAYIDAHPESGYRVVSFADDAPKDPALNGHPVCVIDDIQTPYLICIASGTVKEDIDRRLTAKGLWSPTLIEDPNTCLSNDIHFSPGDIIASGVRLTTNVRVGKHVIINLHSTLGHDVRIADYVTMHPAVHVSGFCNIGKGALLATGAIIAQGLNVGDGATIGAGAVVTKNVPAGETWAGVPARRIK